MENYKKPGFGYKYFDVVKKVLAVFFGLFALVVIVSLFLSSEYSVGRDIKIDCKDSTVKHFVYNPSEWTKWSVWSSKTDSTIVFTYSGPEEGENAIMHFESELMGTGSLKIVDINQNTIVYKMAFSEDSFVIDGLIEIIPQNNATKVNWVITGDVGWNPFAKYLKSVIADLIAEDIEVNLKNLKKICENAQ